MEPLKIAVADFRQNTPDSVPLTQVFNDVLWNDLSNAGIFQLVSKNFYPQAVPGREEEVVAPGALGPGARRRPAPKPWLSATPRSSTTNSSSMPFCMTSPA